MKGTLKVTITIRMDSGRDVLEIPTGTQVNLIRAIYLCKSTLELLDRSDQEAVENGTKMVFYYRGLTVPIKTDDIDIPRFWEGKYNW